MGYVEALPLTGKTKAALGHHVGDEAVDGVGGQAAHDTGLPSSVNTD